MGAWTCDRCSHQMLTRYPWGASWLCGHCRRLVEAADKLAVQEAPYALLLEKASSCTDPAEYPPDLAQLLSPSQPGPSC